MLARAGELPIGDGWAYEVEWDGFRAMVSTEDGLRVRSRPGWNMTMQLLDLAASPVWRFVGADRRARRSAQLAVRRTRTRMCSAMSASSTTRVL